MRSLQDSWQLGGIRIANRLVLAPLAGIGNWFVRLQARRHGAGLVVSEMVSSFGLKHGNERTVREFLRINPDEHPVSVQLFGHDAPVMREAARIVAEERQGLRALYVALTRATKRLALVHAEPLPEALVE